MSGKDKPKTSTWQSIRRLLRLSGRNQVWLAIAIAMAVLGTGFTIAWNFSLARFIDAVAAGQDEIERAANMANIHDTIVSFPNGYGALAGERGARLSGGQRQRIAIAWALLKDAPVLLLDEATSALDSESEELVQRALQALMQGRTVLVIAHRLSTIEGADVIYVVDDGKVVEAGTHDELLGLKGLFFRLHELQFRDEESIYDYDYVYVDVVVVVRS